MISEGVRQGIPIPSNTCFLVKLLMHRHDLQTSAHWQHRMVEGIYKTYPWWTLGNRKSEAAAQQTRGLLLILDSSFGPERETRLQHSQTATHRYEVTIVDVPIRAFRLGAYLRMLQAPARFPVGQYRWPDHKNFAPERTGVWRKRMERRLAIDDD